MKKIILLALTALMMVGCEENKQSLRDGMIVNIDSCQYIVCNVYCGRVYVHHNNCRFCKERKKQELKELVEEIKKEQ